MKKSELSLLYSYILNNRIRLKSDREIDVVDCIELACSIERYNTFKEITNQIKALLNLEVEK